MDRDACLANPDDPAACTRAVTEADASYLDMDDGRLYWRFCADYDEAFVGAQAIPHNEDDPANLLQIDAAGRCPRWAELSAEQQERRVLNGEINPDANSTPAVDVRNDLLTALHYFGVLAAVQPSDLTIDHFTGDPRLLQPGPDGEPESVREIGIHGMRATVNEIATVHMIFGHDFFIRAMILPIGSAADANAQLAVSELLLTRAQRQYELAATMLILTANRHLALLDAPTMVELLGPAERRLLDDALSALATTESELARNTRLIELDADTTSQTEAILHEALRADFPLLAALHASAPPTETFTTSLSAENLINLVYYGRDLGAGLTPLGYPANYGAQQTFSELIAVLCGDVTTCDGGMMAAATNAFDAAAADQRPYDQNLNALMAEMGKLTIDADSELHLLCGDTFDDSWDQCELINAADGGLLAATFDGLTDAAERVALARREIAELADHLLLTQEQAGQNIPIAIGGQSEADAYLQAVAAANAYKLTASVVSPMQIGATVVGTDTQTTTLAVVEIGRLDPAAINSELTLALTLQPATLTPVDYSWAPTMGAPVDFARDVDWWAALKTAQVPDDAPSHFARKLLYRQAQLLIEERLALDSYNARVQQWNRQVGRYARATTLRARLNAADHEIWLMQPHVRLMGSSDQIAASRAFDLAKRMAYLAATAYTHQTGEPFTNLDSLHQAQNPLQLRGVVARLIAAHEGLPNPPRTRQTVRISLAEDIAGLPPALLDPQGALDAVEIALLRDSYWQTMLTNWVVEDEKLVIPITITSLDLALPHTARDVRIADPTAADCASECRGLWVNLATEAAGSGGDGSGAAITLIRRGHSVGLMAGLTEWIARHPSSRVVQSCAARGAVVAVYDDYRYGNH